MKYIIGLLSLAFSMQALANTSLCPKESKTVFECTPVSSDPEGDETLKKLFRNLSVCRGPDWVSLALQKFDGSVEFEKIKTIMTVGEAVSYTGESMGLAVYYVDGNVDRPAKFRVAEMRTSYLCNGKAD